MGMAPCMPAPFGFNPFNAEATFSLIQSTRSQRFEKTSKPCQVGIHKIALTENSQMGTHVPGFQSFFIVLASFSIGYQQHLRVHPSMPIAPKNTLTLLVLTFLPEHFSERIFEEVYIKIHPKSPLKISYEL